MSLPSASCVAVAPTVTETGTTMFSPPPFRTTAPSYMPYGASAGTFIVAAKAPPATGVVVTHGQSTLS